MDELWEMGGDGGTSSTPPPSSSTSTTRLIRQVINQTKSIEEKIENKFTSELLASNFMPPSMYPFLKTLNSRVAVLAVQRGQCTGWLWRRSARGARDASICWKFSQEYVHSTKD